MILGTTDHRPQTNGQNERYNETNVMLRHHYIAEYQRDLDIFVQQLTYAYNTQVYISVNATPFSLVLSRNALETPSLDDISAFSSDLCYSTEPQALRTQLATRVSILRTQLNTRLTLNQTRYKRDHDKNVKRTTVFAPGQMVYIDQLQLEASPGKDADKVPNTKYIRLIPKKMRPFPIIKVTDHVLIINENGMHHAISIQRAKLAPRQDTSSSSTSCPSPPRA